MGLISFVKKQGDVQGNLLEGQITRERAVDWVTGSMSIYDKSKDVNLL